MSKEVKLVFQDCAFGVCQKSVSVQIGEAAKKGIVVRYLPFNHPEAKGLIKMAVNKGVDRLPFFTDGKKFSYNLDDFIMKPKEATKTDEPSPEPTPVKVSRTKKKAAKQPEEAKVEDGDTPTIE